MSASHKLHVLISPEEYRQLRKLAEDDGRSLGGMVRVMIRERYQQRTLQEARERVQRR